MLRSILGYPCAFDLSLRWVVIEGSEAFFDVTKRLHQLLHGSPGDGGPLGTPPPLRSGAMGSARISPWTCWAVGS